MLKRSFVPLVLFAVISSLALANDDGLRKAFANPPDSAWPWVYWFWSDGNISREGITADLEAMHRVGIRGVLIMEVDQGIPKGPARFLGPKWRELFKFVFQEATRLGIEVNMNNDGGWCGSGGPWITPELSMQVVVWSETHVEGPQHFQSTLAQPKTTRDYYRDIAVLAFPEAPGARMAEASPRLSVGANHQAFDAAKLIDGNPGTVATLPAAKAGEPQYLNIEFPSPFTAQALTIALDQWRSTMRGTLEVSSDGREFRTIRPFTVSWPASSVNFDRVSARYYRIAFTPMSGRPAANDVTLGEVELHAEARIEGIPGKAAYINQGSYPAVSGAAISPDMAVRRDKIMDLTARTARSGQLTWDVPQGRWTIVRLGYTTTGKTNHPAPEESLGLECDKLSKKAIEAHFAGLMGKLAEDQRAVGGKALTYTHIDSWEVGSQNWTPGFREAFRERRGYDPLLYLPVVTGRAIESQEVTERFLWDLRRTVADMLLDNYATHMRELSQQHGLKLSIEAYGDGPLDNLPYAGRADMPVSEFWTGSEPLSINKEMASAGHTYGHPIVAAEAFTARPQNGKWLNHPFRLKELGDEMFTQGVNRFIFHRYAMQPWVDRRPGMTMGQWGIHFERTNTWWEQSKAWLTYLARSQYLLQQGHFVADVAYLSSEKAPNQNPSREALSPPMPAGYDYDTVTPELLLTQLSVRDDRLTLPSGMSYRVLVLPAANTMRPALLRKIKELVVNGATVIGPPPSRSPSLSEYGVADQEVQRLAAELWGDCDGASITEHRFGKGRVTWGKPVADVLRESAAPPDFSTLGPGTSQQVRYIHRTIGEDEVYFVANAQNQPTTFLCTFRVMGRQPELWWPDTGRIERTAIYSEQQGGRPFGPMGAAGTRVPIRLDSYGSVFVVFSSGAKTTPRSVVAVMRNGVEITGMSVDAAPDLRGKMNAIRVERTAGRQYEVEVSQSGSYRFRDSGGRTVMFEVPALPSPMEIAGPWNLEFPKGWGAPPQVSLDRLISWTTHADPGVKYFSGTATYRRNIDIPVTMPGQGRRLYLDLGRVQVIAEVKLNGRELGTCWKPPFRVEITAAARPGPNDLEVRVVNLWPNRLIGDEQLPEDKEWAGLQLTKWPQWLLDGKQSPTGRLTFTTWHHWTKDDALLESGLLGPVRLEVAQQLEVNP